MGSKLANLTGAVDRWQQRNRPVGFVLAALPKYSDDNMPGRPALRILEHAWGRPKETVEVREDLTERSLDDLDLSGLLELRQPLLTENGLS